MDQSCSKKERLSFFVRDVKRELEARHLGSVGVGGRAYGGSMGLKTQRRAFVAGEEGKG